MAVDHTGNRDRGSVLVIGSANMDAVLRVPELPGAGATVLGGDRVMRPGGKGANQAVAAALAGAAVSFVGRVGDDADGAAIRAAVAAVGVDVELLETVAGASSGFAVVLVAASGENAIAVAPAANRTVRPADIDRIADAVRTADVVLLQLEIPLDAVARAAEIAADAGTLVVLNLSPVAALPPDLLRRVGVLVVNRAEAEQLLGEDLADRAALLEAAPRLRSIGPAAVVVTAGGDGAVLADGQRAEHVPARPVDVVDTTGAGDAFAGFLAAALGRGLPLADAVRAGVEAGTAAVGSSGAQLNAAATVGRG
jgi:ribokinase